MLHDTITAKVATMQTDWPTDRLKELAKFMLEGLCTAGYKPTDTAIKEADFAAYFDVLKRIIENERAEGLAELDAF